MATAVDVHVGGRVRARRIMMGMSQQKLAKCLSITFQQVQKYEKGTNRIRASRLYEMARVLEVPIAYFFDDLPELPVKESDTRSAGLELFSHKEGARLADAFMRIADPRIRRALVELAEVAAG